MHKMLVGKVPMNNVKNVVSDEIVFLLDFCYSMWFEVHVLKIVKFKKLYLRKVR